jgi:hypothetical protein
MTMAKETQNKVKCGPFLCCRLQEGSMDDIIKLVNGESRNTEMRKMRLSSENETVLFKPKHVRTPIFQGKTGKSGRTVIHIPASTNHSHGVVPTLHPELARESRQGRGSEETSRSWGLPEGPET